MANQDYRTGFFDPFGSPAKNFMENFQIELVVGEPHNVQRRSRLTSHRVDIAQAIGRCNLPEKIGVVDEWGKKVERLKDHQVIAQAERPGIARAVSSD